MHSKRTTLLTTLALLTLAAEHTAQNDILVGNGAENVFFYNDPSTGSITGSPTLGADGYWKVTPGDLTVDPTGASAWIGIENHFIGSTDWTTGSIFWDIGIGGASSATGLPLGDENLVPDFFTSGSVSAVISIGNPGFPNPCSISPTGCTNGTGGATPPICPPPVSGFNASVTLTSPFPLSGNGVTSSSLYHFAPGGMGVFTSTAACGFGDFDFSGAHSTDENQADSMAVLGEAYLGGFQIGASTPSGTPSGPIADPLTNLNTTAFSYASAVAEALTEDTVVGFPLENGSSSPQLDTSSGGARFGATAHGLAEVGALAFPAASPAFLTPPGPPGFFLPGLGGTLLISPVGIFNATFSAWAGTGPVIGTDVDGDTVDDEGRADSSTLPVPPGPPRCLYVQYVLVIGFGPIQVVTTMAYCARTQ